MKIVGLYSFQGFKRRKNHQFRYNKRQAGILNYLRYFGLFVVIGITLIVLLSIGIVGIDKQNSVKKKGNDEVDKFKMESKDILLKEKNEMQVKAKVYITKEKKVQEMDLEEYVRGVVAAEMQANFEVQALKAQAVAARTYALAHMKLFNGTSCSEGTGADLCDSTHCQVYMNKEDRMKGWAESQREGYWKKITNAVQETRGEVLTYNGDLVMNPYYFAISSGKTENAKEVFAVEEPYLKSVSSNGEEIAPKYKSSVKVEYGELVAKINKCYPKAEVSLKKIKTQLNILSRSEGGSVKSIKVGNVLLKGTEFRSLLGLNSSDFMIHFNSNFAEVECLGYGHGVGMSQWGANVMAKDGKTYKQILTHYYQGVEVQQLDSIHSK